MNDQQPAAHDGTACSTEDDEGQSSKKGTPTTIQGTPFDSVKDYDDKCRKAEGFGDPENPKGE